MLSSLTTKIALRKVGLSSDALDFSAAAAAAVSPADEPARRKPPRKRSTGLRRGNRPAAAADGDYADDEDDDDGAAWPAWMSLKALPLTVHPWLAPPPPPVAVARVPLVGDVAPRDRDRKLDLGAGRRVLVVFLRCVGCAFAQRTFLNLRTLANRHAATLTCVAVSHSSEHATREWIDLLGGAWGVRVVVDEDRAVYAAWGLGLAGVWHLFHPAAQLQGWREKGWLGDRVAQAVQRPRALRAAASRAPAANAGAADDADADADAASTVLGNKWQEAGAFAVDGRGTVVWGGKAQRADDVMDLDEGVRILCM